MLKTHWNSKKRSLSLAICFCLSLGINLPVKADSTNVRCDFYPKGEDKATLSTSCTFFQRQGFIGITKPDGTNYDFVPNLNEAGLYEDSNGNTVLREINGDIGLIFRTAQESIFIFWDDSRSNTQVSSSNSSQPQTYTTVKDFNNIAIQITEGDFKFHGNLQRTSSKVFTGSDEQVRVSLDPYSGKVVVINKVTGDEFYNYYISPVSGVGEDPDTMCDPTTEPC